MEPVDCALKEALPDGEPESDGDRDCRADAELELSAVGDGDPISVAVDRGDADDEGVTTSGVDVESGEPLASALDRALGVLETQADALPVCKPGVADDSTLSLRSPLALADAIRVNEGAVEPVAPAPPALEDDSADAVREGVDDRVRGGDAELSAVCEPTSD